MVCYLLFWGQLRKKELLKSFSIFCDSNENPWLRNAALGSKIQGGHFCLIYHCSLRPAHSNDSINEKIIWKRTLNILAEDSNYLGICDFEGESADFEFT